MKLAPSTASRSPSPINMGEEKGELDPSGLDEGLFQDEVAGRGQRALFIAALYQQGLEFGEDGGTAAEHQAIDGGIQRRDAQVLEDLARGDQVGDAALGLERLAGHGRIVAQLAADQFAEDLVLVQFGFQQLAIVQVGDVAHGVRDDHLVEALIDVRVTRQREPRRKARAGADALEALGLPAAVLGGRGQLLACNGLMDTLIPATVQDCSGRAKITDKKADALLESALSALAGGARGGIVQSFPITGENGRPSSVVHLLPVRGSAHDLFSRIHCILVIMPLPGPGAPSANVLQALFDLTPSEARIASALADGRSIDAISVDFGIARETVRSHLRSIFAKSGVSKQSSLVRLLLGVTLPRASC